MQIKEHNLETKQVDDLKEYSRALRKVGRVAQFHFWTCAALSWPIQYFIVCLDKPDRRMVGGVSELVVSLETKTCKGHVVFERTKSA